MDPLSTTTTTANEAGEVLSEKLAFGRYSKYLSTSPDGNGGGDLNSLMEGPIRKKLKIVPNNVT